MKSLIHTPTNKIEDSLKFYQKLDFKVVSKEKPLIVTDGKAFIEINPDRYARAGVKFFKKSWEKEIKAIEKLNAVHRTQNGFVCADPSGVWIYLIEGEPAPEVKPAETTFGVLGNFMGLSLESTDMTRSTSFWSAIGLEIKGSPDQGWISAVHEDGLTVNIMKPMMCPHLFFNPSLTYFNGKENNPKIIRKIRDLGIPITEEITHFNDQGVVDNVIIRDPGGYGFFVFND